MEGNVIFTWAKIAGIGGAAIGFLALILRIILRQHLTSQLDKRSAFILLIVIIVVAWTTSLAGIGVWYLIETKRYTSGLLYRVRHVRSDESLSVREGPGVNNRELVKIPFNGRDIQIQGEATKVSDGGTWVRIRYKGVEGWVNSYFLQPQ